MILLKGAEALTPFIDGNVWAVALRKNSKKGLKWNTEAYVKCNLHWITMIFLQQTGSTDVIYVHLDLASLKSVRSFAETFLKTESRLDLLINNAGTHTTTQHHNVCLVASTRSILPFSSTPTSESQTPLGGNLFVELLHLGIIKSEWAFPIFHLRTVASDLLLFVFSSQLCAGGCFFVKFTIPGRLFKKIWESEINKTLSFHSERAWKFCPKKYEQDGWQSSGVWNSPSNDNKDTELTRSTK